MENLNVFGYIATCLTIIQVIIKWYLLYHDWTIISWKWSICFLISKFRVIILCCTIENCFLFKYLVIFSKCWKKNYFNVCI